MITRRVHRAANFIGFQANWFACVLGAAAGHPWLGPLLVAMTVAIHVAIVRRWGARRRDEVAILVIAGVIGYVADSALVLAGTMSFTNSVGWGGPSPIWMIALWVNFAATIRWSMSWLRGRPILAAGFGAIGGPIAYYTGSRFGAIALEDNALRALAAIGAVWLVVTPLLVGIAAFIGRPRGRVVMAGEATGSLSAGRVET